MRRPGYLNGFTLGSILRQNTRLFGELPPLAAERCDKDQGTTLFMSKENKRREQALRERLANCRKKLESTDWSSGSYYMEADRAKEALQQLETAEKVYVDMFASVKGDDLAVGPPCIFFHNLGKRTPNIAQAVFDQLWVAEMKAGIIPPLIQDQCAEKNDPKLSTAQGAEQDVRNRLTTAREKFHSVDWKQAGVVAEDLAKKAIKELEQAEEQAWHQFNAHSGWTPEGPLCKYAIFYQALQPFLIKAEDAVNEAVAKASDISKAKKQEAATEQVRVETLKEKLSAGLTSKSPDALLGPIVERPTVGGLFGWLQRIFGF